jgi:hypothetical protein
LLAQRVSGKPWKPSAVMMPAIPGKSSTGNDLRYMKTFKPFKSFQSSESIRIFLTA